MTKCSYITCILIILTAASIVASPESFYSKNLPSGVALGMMPDELAQARPEARENNLIRSSNTESELMEMVEIVRQTNSGVAFWYRFKNGKLGAVSRSVSTKNLSAESAQQSATLAYNEIRANFDLLRQEEILRSTGMSVFLLSTQLWEDKTKGLNIYFVASSQECTLIVFDPEFFGSTDFFVPIDKRKQIDAQAKLVQDLLGESVPPPPSIVDLLPKVATEFALTSTTPPEAATPPPAPTEESQSTAPATPRPSATASTETKSSRGFPIVPVAIVGAMILGMFILFLRRKSS